MVLGNSKLLQIFVWRKKTLPNGINSDFKKPKYMTCISLVFWVYFHVLGWALCSAYCYMIFLKGGGFAINLKGSMEEWEEQRFCHQTWVWMPPHRGRETRWESASPRNTGGPACTPGLLWGPGVNRGEGARTACRQGMHPRGHFYFRWQRLPSENITCILWHKFT